MKKNLGVNWKQCGLIAALCFTGWGYMSDSVVVPLASSIFNEFPEASLFLQNFVLSGSCLVAIPFALLSGWLCRHISKRKILLLSLVFFLAGGVGGYFSQSMEFLALMRALDGASDGIAVTIVAALIGELFQNEKLRGTVFGWNQAISALFGVVMALAAGWAATHIGWRYAFLVHLLDFISLALVLAFVPETPVDKTEGEHGVLRQGAKTAVVCLFTYFVFTLLCSQVYYTVDLYIAERGIGDAMLSGQASAIMSVVMCALDLVFGLVYARTRRIFPILFCIVNTVGLACFAIGSGPAAVLLGSALTSLCSAAVVPYYQLRISAVVDKRALGTYMSAFAVLMYLGSFCAPYIGPVIRFLSGSDSVITAYIVCTVTMAFITLIYTLVCAKRMKKE